ncbi:SRPBCC family protein [Carboxylicivirga marina]|uniref:Polyketide cyclase n=1 Tax=Carboxylicivirga marina TaxID=2800988 RepID=A0ABS1HQ68_9BACT|nr:hypothetical protein [Carboxylicivirga marina]MBK3519822.1 hypothetical protein [Carboxylicivirga marina]
MIIALIVIGVIIIGLFIWLLSIDGSYHVKKSMVVNTSKEKAFQLVSDFNTWQAWSPWLCMEPEAKVTISNNGVGIGAVNA